MPGDYSRKTFNRKKHYRGVLMQQGRVQLDADWNEQLAIQLYRDETEAKDVIGLCGAPKSGDAFKITSNGSDLLITPGRIYVGGLLCELEMGAQATYANQPYYPNPEFTSPLSSPLASPLASPPGGPQLNLDDGVYLAYIDAWQREITALDDPLIREKALGGPDTAARLQSVWQVRLLRVTTNNGNVTCKTPLPEYLLRIAAGTGKMTAQTKKADDPKDPCLLPPKAGYLRLENQLYRVEAHKGGDRSEASFKWSRDNATVETTVNTVSGSLLTVSETGKDETLAFHDGDWVELVTEEATLKREPFPLAQIDHVDPNTREIILKIPVPAKAADAPRLKLRRWDQNGANANSDGVKMALANMIDLEGGVQVGFSAGSYRPGDYWLIPARTVTGEIEWPPFEIPNNNPQAQLPFAVKHQYCRLALVESKGGVIQVKEDCRKKFPPLTEICAEDVCYDNDNCNMPGVETVQEALDRLCAARDLRHHNKHLHGWGIVCGLQVECGPDSPGQPRRHVTVRKGYAIDCEGNDVILDNNEKLDLAAMSAGLPSPLASPLSSPPTGLADGELALFVDLDEKQQRRFRVERYTPPKNDWQSLLKGTLLADFINECILSLADFFKEQFTVGTDEAKLPVGPARKRLSTLLNLIVQLINPTNGSFVFISREEDRILRDFYGKLRALLQSHTFCAMFDGARQFPDAYPFPDQDIVTIFGKGSQQRLRVAPNGAVAYAVGSGSNKIAVYDLTKNEMAEELVFPGGSNALVQDVAFSANGRELYAVATLNDKDTSFAVADVIGLNHFWRQPTVICDVLLVTLATAPNISADVYAVGKGKGLYQINPQNVNATPTPMGNLSFVATGQLTVFAQEGVAYAAASAVGAASNLYSSVVRVNLRSPTNNPPAIQLRTPAGQQAEGQDDIALAFPAGQRVKLYVVVNPTSGLVNKQVMIFDAANGSFLAQRDLGEAGTDIRLAFNQATNRMAVAYEESYRLAILNVDDVPEPNFRFPVQISPLSIAVAPDNRRVYVLNFASDTVSSISADLLAPNRQLSMNDLVDYRTAVLNAFFDLAGGFLQYLKDCLCDHFLVDCPTCDSDDKLYLAVISVKNGQVHKVCNFSLRKYVKSFPTVEYWLSLVPILPLVKKAVESFCCSVLPDFFGRRNAPRAKVVENQIEIAPNRVKSSSVRTGVQFVKTTDIRSATREGVSKVTSSRSLVFDALTKGTRSQEVSPPSFKHSDIAGHPVDEAKSRLETAKIKVVEVQPYDPSAGLTNLVEFSRAPLRLEEGAQVKLITKGDKVLYYARVEAKSPQIRTTLTEAETAKVVKAEAEKLRSELSDLRKEIQEMERKHQEALAARDEEIAELKTGAKELKLNIKAVNELKEQVAKLSKAEKPARLVKRRKGEGESKE